MDKIVGQCYSRLCIYVETGSILVLCSEQNLAVDRGIWTQPSV